MNSSNNGARVTSLGIEFPPTPLPAAVWREMLGEAVRDLSTSCWRVGDLLNHGEAAYGQTYAEAIAETGLGYQTVANLKSIAGKIEFSRRRENLSFAHHAEVAALSPTEQDRLLVLAAANRWSRATLRAHVAKSRAPARATQVRTISVQPEPSQPIPLAMPKTNDVIRTPWPKLPEIRQTGRPTPVIDKNSKLPKPTIDDVIYKTEALAAAYEHDLPHAAKALRRAIDEMREQEKPVAQPAGGVPTPTAH